MKITLVHDNFDNEQHGIFNHTSNLYSRLSTNPYVDSVYELTPIKNKKIYGLLPISLFQLYHLVAAIKKQNPDIVHIHGTHLPYALLPLVLKNKFITIVTLHGIVALDSKESIRNRLLCKHLIFKYFEKISVRNASFLIAVSPAVKKMIQDMYYPSCNIEVIPNGVNLSDFKLNYNNIKLKHPCIFFIGRLVKTKNIGILIKAFSLVKSKFPNTHLYIAGTGPQISNLKKMVSKYDLTDDVTFLGYIFGDMKISYYKSVDICVVPSKFESFSIVTLEAMASSKAVVASNVGGIPYLVEDGLNGFLFSPSDHVDLCEKISFLLENNNLRKEMGKAGCKKATSFEWDLIVAKTVDCYKSLLGCE
ncbi:glycosyltransferase family 4 protein [Methanolobus sediminis]|uniref:Glycosyltransferase family 4 protein n=1 Tax=Methanolobus sediminis TaxID=3072978 RepID=A0AA51UNQ0_9EURY|nr:glycosyltransferase family 4 protein [Methanolobus sediminis]WMW25430.1 glycosyltransferase family 4 protein [Methanolobus sediminis]